MLILDIVRKWPNENYSELYYMLSLIHFTVIHNEFYFLLGFVRLLSIEFFVWNCDVDFQPSLFSLLHRG